MATNGQKGNSPRDRDNQNPKSGWFRKTMRWGVDPAAYFGTNEIRANAEYIGDLWTGVRQGSRHRRRRLTPEGTYDIVAMAFDYGTSPARIEEMIFNSQVIAARACRIYMGCGVGLLVYWAYRMLVSPIGLGNLFYVLLVLAMVLFFFLLSFLKAAENWRLRTRRPGTLAEFLHTEDSWWPR